MTKRRVFEIVRDLWLWLADNPDERKKDWPEWEYNGGKIKQCVADCPCCEYASDCSECLMLALWPFTGCGDPCMGSRSPYTEWSWTGIPALKKENALIIANGAIAELDKMDKKKEKS